MSENVKMESENDFENFDLKLKVMVLGESMVGKTSLITRYTNEKFGGRYLCTVGIDFQKKKLLISNKKIVLQIWDTAGQERFRNVTKNYFHASQGFVLAYDINNKDSFEKMQYWVEEIQSNADEKIKCILVGTKCDLDSREVSYDEGKNLGKKYGYKFYETSAKDNININETFETLVKEIVDNYQERTESITLSRRVSKKKNKHKNCC